MKERIEKIIAAGANVIMTTMGMDDVANKYLVENNILGLRRVPKADMRKIAKCTGATVITTMATPEGDEIFES